ncbi:MAG: N-acetyl-gamma-glutamyl-phosphate reductase [Verrucomicrobiota bacterium]|nr:N-acetyl-gamma-glutamyl-phosphate reductase [Verrucomicrobiota bacterium]
MKIGIAGASGYSGETLVNLLLRHPQVELAAVTSRQLAGKCLSEVMPSTRGPGDKLAFTVSDPVAMAAREDIAVWFLALPHGVAAEYASALIAAGKRVFDLSADFRLGTPALYKEYYEHDHPAPELIAKSAYVIPELKALADWQHKSLIACPGCYPTSIQLPLIPLLRAGLLETKGIVINSYSGISGAGRQAKEFYSFAERTESMTAYGQPKHRHLSEIEEQLGAAAGRDVIVQFNPHLAPLKRGILSTITVPAAAGATIEAVYAAWNATYTERPFVKVLPSGTYPDTAAVQHTNRADMMGVHDRRTGNFIVTCAIDNLLKGAAGQAIQNFNLALGFPETAGLY